MICAWNELLSVLPDRMRKDVDSCGKTNLQELRLRVGKNPELVMQNDSVWLNQLVCDDDLKFCVNTASKYSPWSAETAADGYITAAGGHRMGLCGDAVVHENQMRGIRTLSSISIRVARDYPGIGSRLSMLTDSVLILGKPGSGKTTLLRDVIRQISNRQQGCVAVVDERREIFPTNSGHVCFETGKRTDILQGCPKEIGIDNVLRTMGPRTIAVDEITAEADCQALIRAGWCGVQLLATAHAMSIQDLKSRPIYHSLWKSGIFSYAVILNEDKSWYLERMI